MQNLSENTVTHVVGTSKTLSGWWQDMGESSDTDLGDQEEGALLLKCWRRQFDFLSENLDNYVKLQ